MYIAVPNTLTYDDLFWRIHADELDYNLNLYAIFEDDAASTTPAQPAETAAAPLLLPRTTPPPLTPARPSRRKSMRAIANGTWGIEYTTCQKCGYHNWTRQGNVYVCDTQATRPPRSSAPRV